MAKNYSEINLKAATVTGAIVGFLCWLLVIPFSANGFYGMMGYVPNTGMMDIYHTYSVSSVLLDIVLGMVGGAIIAAIYNWTLKMKW